MIKISYNYKTDYIFFYKYLFDLLVYINNFKI